MTTLRLHPRVRVIATPERVVFRTDQRTFALDGPAHTLFVDVLMPLLDGTRSREDVAAAARGHAQDSLLSFLDLLIEKEVIEAGSGRDDETALPAWGMPAPLVDDERTARQGAGERLRAARVIVAGLEPAGVLTAVELAAAGVGTMYLLDDGAVRHDDLSPASPLRRAHLGQPRRDALRDVLSAGAPWRAVETGSLAEWAAQGPAGGEHWDMLVGAPDEDDLKGCLALARAAHALKLTSLLGALHGSELHVGPLVIPGQTACWNCCRLRMVANAAYPAEAQELQHALLHGYRLHGPRAQQGAPARLLGGLLAVESIRTLAAVDPSPLLGRLLVQDMKTTATTLHAVVPLPWCDICGGAHAMPPPSSRTALDAASMPQAVRSVLAGWVDPRTGLISHLLDGSTAVREPALPVCAVAALSAYSDGVAPPARPGHGFGKGLTATDALIGAAAEAIEHYAAARVRLGDLRRASYDELRGDALDPRSLCLYDAAQYDRPGFPFVPFDPARPLLWTRGHWLDTRRPVWLPAAAVYLDPTVDDGAPWAQMTSNGLAAGADLEDAAARAVLELVERDAFLLTWLSRRPGRRLDPGAALEPGCRKVLQSLQERGARVELYRLDAGLSIPTVVCLGLGDGCTWPGAAIGLGSHTDLRVAVRKAILELGQVGPTLCQLVQSGEQRIPARREDVRGLLDHALFYVPRERASAFDTLRAGPQEPAWPGGGNAAGGAALDSLIAPIAAGGVRIAVVDVTPPDVARSPFCVARAVGTDMQAMSYGWGLERLANPRLRALCPGPTNPYPHPLC